MKEKGTPSANTIGGAVLDRLPPQKEVNEENQEKACLGGKEGGGGIRWTHIWGGGGNPTEIKKELEGDRGKKGIPLPKRKFSSRK